MKKVLKRQRGGERKLHNRSRSKVFALMTHSGPDREDLEGGGQEKREMGFSHSPFHVDEIILQRLLRDGTLANLQLGSRIIMNIVDAHLVANGEAAQSGILIGQRIIIAGGHQCISLQRSRSLPEERERERTKDHDSLTGNTRGL